LNVSKNCTSSVATIRSCLSLHVENDLIKQQFCAKPTNAYRRASLAAVVGAVAASMLSGCASLAPGPKNILLSQERLQQIIGSQFPFNNRLLDILEVQASSPRIGLDAATNRITTGLDLGLASRGIGALLSERDIKGSIDLSYGLRFEPSDQSVRMTDVRVTKLDVPLGGQRWSGTVGKLGSALAEQVLRDYPLYKFSAKDLDAAKGWGYKPGAFTITAQGLNLSLQPVQK
jgi:hypothetical protein